MVTPTYDEMMDLIPNLQLRYKFEGSNAGVIPNDAPGKSALYIGNSLGGPVGMQQSGLIAAKPGSYSAGIASGGMFRTQQAFTERNDVTFLTGGWFKFTNFSGSPVFLAHDADGVVGAIRWRAYVATDGKLHMTSRHQTNYGDNVCDGAALVAGAIYHIALQAIDATNYQFYVNFVPYGSVMTIPSAMVTNAAGYFEVGGIYGIASSSTMTGNVGDVFYASSSDTDTDELMAAIGAVALTAPGVNFVNETAQVTFYGSDPLVVTKPAGVQEGDLLVCYRQINDGDSSKIQDIPGWITQGRQIHTPAGGWGSPHSFSCHTKVASDSEPASYSLPVGAYVNHNASIVAYRGGIVVAFAENNTDWVYGSDPAHAAPQVTFSGAVANGKALTMTHCSYDPAPVRSGTSRGGASIDRMYLTEHEVSTETGAYTPPPYSHTEPDQHSFAQMTLGIAPTSSGPKLYLGSTKVDKLALGSTELSAGFLGTDSIFEVPTQPEVSSFGDDASASTSIGGGSYSMGLEFYVTAPAKLKAIKYVQRAGVNGIKQVALYIPNGTTGAQVISPVSSAAGAPVGWVRVDVPEYTLVPNTRYKAVVFYPDGFTSAAAFLSADRTTGILKIPSNANALHGGNMTAAPGAALQYTHVGYNNYYGVDVVVQPT